MIGDNKLLHAETRPTDSGQSPEGKEAPGIHWDRVRIVAHPSCWRYRRPPPDKRPVLFLDLDNTLYPKSSGLGEQARLRVATYFEHVLGLPHDESQLLGARYFRDYGLAIRGVLKHFGGTIDPIEYDRYVDGGLQLDTVLLPDDRLRNLLLHCRARVWVFTNAGLYHARRALRLMQLDGAGGESLIEGIVYCNYAEPDFPAKPDRLAYERAMMIVSQHPNDGDDREDGDGHEDCGGREDGDDDCRSHVAIDWSVPYYFADDSRTNVQGALAMGWRAILVDEDVPPAATDPHGQPSQGVGDPHSVRDTHVDAAGIGSQRMQSIPYVHMLDRVFPELFFDGQ